MYKIGEFVIYGSEGVCKIEAIGHLEIPAIGKDRLYYTLSPLYHVGKTYTPVDTGVFMRPVLTQEEAEALMQQIPEIKSSLMETENKQMQPEHYDTLLRSYDCRNLVRLVLAISMKQEFLLTLGKKLPETDARYRRKAEDMLMGELAVALCISKDYVKEHIAEILLGKSIMGSMKRSRVS